MFSLSVGIGLVFIIVLLIRTAIAIDEQEDKREDISERKGTS